MTQGKARLLEHLLQLRVSFALPSSLNTTPDLLNTLLFLSYIAITSIKATDFSHDTLTFLISLIVQHLFIDETNDCIPMLVTCQQAVIQLGLAKQLGQVLRLAQYRLAFFIYTWEWFLF